MSGSQSFIINAKKSRGVGVFFASALDLFDEMMHKPPIDFMPTSQIGCSDATFSTA